MTEHSSQAPDAPDRPALLYTISLVIGGLVLAGLLVSLLLSTRGTAGESTEIDRLLEDRLCDSACLRGIKPGLVTSRALTAELTSLGIAELPADETLASDEPYWSVAQRPSRVELNAAAAEVFTPGLAQGGITFLLNADAVVNDIVVAEPRLCLATYVEHYEADSYTVHPQTNVVYITAYEDTLQTSVNLETQRFERLVISEPEPGWMLAFVNPDMGQRRGGTLDELIVPDVCDDGF